jgi:hypothetical protein
MFSKYEGVKMCQLSLVRYSENFVRTSMDGKQKGGKWWGGARPL